jgi:hypothetical protein
VSNRGKQKTAMADRAPVNQGRHESQCTVCKHPQREEIEREFIGWRSPDKIAKQFKVCVIPFIDTRMPATLLNPADAM